MFVKLCLAKLALPRKVHPMPTRSDAEEHLRIIRSLMEKATIYRAISAEGAAVGGVLAIAASFALGTWWNLPNREGGWMIVDGPHLIAVWIAVLAITGFANLAFLWRNARKRGDRFISSGMRLAVRALFPTYLVAAFCTWFIGFGMFPSWIVPIWIICHGLALLATSHFAPRSLIFLGWAFVIAGLVSISPITGAIFPNISGLGVHSNEAWDELTRNYAILYSQRWMAGTFGLFHLIYAACTWPRRARGGDASGTP